MNCVNPDDGEPCEHLRQVPSHPDRFDHPLWYCAWDSEPVEIDREAPEWCHRREELR